MADEISTLENLGAAPQQPPMPGLPSGNMLEQGGPTLPTPGGGLVDRLGNAVAQAVGYATQNPQLQQQAIGRQDLAAKMQMLAPVAQAHAKINERLAAGDLAGANQLYQQIAHLSPMFPDIQKTGDMLAQKTFQQNYLVGNRNRALDQLDSLARNEQDPMRQQLYRDAHQMLSVSPLEETPSAAITAAMQTSKMGIDVSRLAQEGIQYHTVNGRLVMTDKRNPSGASTVQEALPEVQFYGKLPTKIQEALGTLPGFHMTEYDRLRASPKPEDQAKADDWINRGSVQAAVASQPSEARITAAAADIDPGRLASGLSSDEAHRFRQQELAVDESKKSTELTTANRIKLETTPASMLPGAPEGYVTRDGKFSVIPSSGLYAKDAFDATRTGQTFPLKHDQLQALELTTRMEPQLNRGEQLANRLFAGVGPGQNWINAIALKGGAAAGQAYVRERDALNTDLQAELARMATGSRVLATLMMQYKDKVVLSDTDTYQSALAKIELVRNLQKNFKESMANMPLSDLDPYETNTTLRMMGQGARPVFGPDGQTITGYIK
jgi:hypothetical protein